MCFKAHTIPRHHWHWIRGATRMKILRRKNLPRDTYIMHYNTIILVRQGLRAKTIQLYFGKTFSNQFCSYLEVLVWSWTIRSETRQLEICHELKMGFVLFLHRFIGIFHSESKCFQVLSILQSRLVFAQNPITILLWG